MAIQFFDRRGNETDGEGNRVYRFKGSVSGASANDGEIYFREEKKPKKAAATPPPAAPAPPPPPGDGPKSGVYFNKGKK